MKSSIPPVVIIKPSRGWISLKLEEFWEYRELLYFLTWRDIKVRYKQTVLGAAWAIIQPFLPWWCSVFSSGNWRKCPPDSQRLKMLLAADAEVLWLLPKIRRKRREIQRRPIVNTQYIESFLGK